MATIIRKYVNNFISTRALSALAMAAIDRRPVSCVGGGEARRAPALLCHNIYTHAGPLARARVLDRTGARAQTASETRAHRKEDKFDY